MVDDRSRPHRRPGRWRILAAVNVGYAVVLVALAVAPDVPAPMGVPVPDWFAHAAAYGLQALLLSALMAYRVPVVQAAFGGAVCACAFGFGTECLQLLQPARAVEGADLVANAVGATIAGLGVVLARRLLQRQSEGP